ncbi:shTK domain protein [Dictyocaulus viviparus]|uniref:Metalloendopeptidase n=1 Tax=Dictyocaulus viviparus TaxID=29172 RepID=A0A0D8XDK7_DICVI|nr:shTK domain protein [Dictyocaulus viviparus]
MSQGHCLPHKRDPLSTPQIDRSVPEYETVLTPEDFELGEEIVKSSRYILNEIEDPESMYEKSLFEGDIANKNASLKKFKNLTSSTIEMFITGGIGKMNGNWYNAIKNRLQLWPNGRIPYTISSQYSTYSRSIIAASMQEYSIHTCIEWVPKTNNDVNYVYIFPDRGCYSMVGKIGGKQSLSLGTGCIQKGIIIHELMHAVGFFHEQSRTDRDDYITILWNNIQPGMQDQWKFNEKVKLKSTADPKFQAFSRNGQPTMVPKQKGAQIGQRGGFSKTDIYKLNKLYGCPNEVEKPETKFTRTSSTHTPMTLPTTVIPPEVLTTSPSTPSVNPLLCRNLRGDCDKLRNQGWCKRNPEWMLSHCSVSCGFCEKTATPISTAVPSTSVVTSPPNNCEDLRVDCLLLVSQRYT